MAYLKSGVRGQIAEAEADDADGALSDVKRQLDDRDASRRSQRRMCEGYIFAVPTVEEYREGLAAAKLTSVMMDMLIAHAKSGDHGMTAGEIAQAGGYDHFETANAQYGRVGRLIAEAMDVSPPDAKRRDGDVATAVLAGAGTPRPDTGNFVWVMYPELREALIGS